MVIKKFGIFILLILVMVSFSSAFDWDTELKAYYDLEDNQDSSVNAKHLTSGTGIYTAGLIGNCLNNSYIYGQFADFGINASSDKSFSISLWVNKYSIGTQNILGFDDTLANPYYGTTAQYALAHASGGSRWQSAVNDWKNLTNVLDNPPIGWRHLVAVKNSTNLMFYVNGTLKQTIKISSWNSNLTREFLIGAYNITGEGLWKGKIDEVGIWQRELTPADITFLYNGGVGVGYMDNLIYNYNGTNISISYLNETTMPIILSQTLIDYAREGDTFYLNYTDGPTNYSTSFILTTKKNLTLWYTNATATYRQDFSWTYKIFENEITYNPAVLEGSIETFTLNLDSSSNIISAKINYNGTDYSSGILSLGGGKFNITNTLQIPDFPGSVNVSFYFNISLSTGESIISLINSQSIQASLLDDCSVYSYKLFNLSLYDERLLNPIQGNIEVDLTFLNQDGSTQLTTLSSNFQNVTNGQICSNINLTDGGYLYSMEIRYFSRYNSSTYTHVPEFYHIQRGTSNNFPVSIPLYDLNVNESTEFTLRYRNNNYVAQEGVLLQIERKYTDEGIYRTVEIPITSSEGTAIGHFDLNNYKYRITATLNGEILNIFTSPAIVCESELSGICVITLNGQGSPNTYRDIDEVQGISYSIIQNATAITVTYTIPSGETKTVSVLMVQTSPFSSAILCNTSLTSSAGSFECLINPTIGDSEVDITISFGGAYRRARVYVQEELGDFFLLNNYAIASLLVILLVTMMVSSPKIMVVIATFSVALLGFLFLIKGSSIGLVLGAMSWLIVCGILILIKINKQDET